MSNTANNHHSNVRWATKRERCQNLLGNKTGANSSQYVGASWKNREQRWSVQIRLDGENKALGTLKAEPDAAQAHDQALAEAGPSVVNF